MHDSIDFKIAGGKKLSGSVTTNTSKNGAMGLIPAALLNRAPTTLHGIPRIEEVSRMLEVLESIGVKATWTGEKTLVLTPPEHYTLDALDTEAAKRMRSTLMLIGPLMHVTDTFVLPHAGGCKMGARTIAAHQYGLEVLGYTIETTEEAYVVTKVKLHGGDVTMYEMSDTATINVLLAAARIPEETVISFAPSNYQVQDVCFFLERLGVEIDGVGTSTLRVRGKKDISEPVEHNNSEDPIEAMMWLSATIVTGSELTIERVPIDFLKLELMKLEKMGLKYEQSKVYFSKNERTKLVDLTVYPSKLTALSDKIHPLPYPGINIDNLPFFVPIATQAEGTTLIHDWPWENRAIYFTELNRLGADIALADPHRVFVHGKTELNAAQVVCPPALRPAMIVLIAMLAAPGTSILRNVYSIKRGYEEIAERLNTIGADIEVMHGV